MTEDELNRRLDAIHARLAWISDAEARAAWIGGWAAQGWHNPERTRLIEQAEKVLDELEKIGGAPKFKAAPSS